MSMADEIADKQSRMTLDAIDEAVTKAGNVSSVTEMPPQTLIDSLAKMQIPFKADGTHNPLTIVSGPVMEQKIRAILAQIDSDPKWQQAYQKMIARKKAEWHARESSRKLVG
jgi:hypothetical protein